MLSVAGLTKRYGQLTALEDVSFTVERGQIVGFVGPNGAGKTTTMRAVLRVVDVDGGEVRWDGHPVDDATRSRIGYMPAERGLYPRMQVGEHITYLARLAGLGAADARAATQRWLGELGLADRAEDEVQSLSSGNMQRVQLALALVHEPDLLLLDEPFAGLDPIAAQTMSRILADRVADGAAVLFSSHQLDMVQDISRDVVLIDGGRIVLDGATDELRAASPRRYLDVTVRGAEPGWEDALGLEVLERGPRGRVVLVARADEDPRRLLAVADAAGDVEAFSWSPPDLSEVFREAVGR